MQEQRRFPIEGEPAASGRGGLGEIGGLLLAVARFLYKIMGELDVAELRG